MPSVTKPAYERIVVIHNPSGVRLAEACEEELRSSKLNKPVLRLMSAAGGHLPNAERLAGKLRAGDVIGGVFGDGTARDIIGALILPEIVDLVGQVPFASLAGGNARDIGRATQKHRHAPPSAILTQSVAVDAYAMGANITHESTTESHHAISYIGVGKSAKATAFINSPAYRLGAPGLRDLQVGFGGIVSKHTFELLDNEEHVRQLGELTFAKGPCMAKIGHFPVEYWEERMRVTPVRKGILAASIAAGGLLVGHAAGEYHESYAFSLTSPTSMHFDGEPPVELMPDDDIEVFLHSQPYTILTTRLDHTE